MHIVCTFLIYYIWYIGTVRLFGQYCNGGRMMKIGKKFQENGKYEPPKYILSYNTQWARKFKKVQAKKTLVKSNKSISRKKFFWPNSIFCYFKNGQKSIFELGKSLNLPKMQFHEFFPLDFLKFSGRLCHGVGPKKARGKWLFYFQ